MGDISQTPKTAGLIEVLERRAINRRRESYGVLVVMLLLLTLAAWVFAHAKEIATAETSRNSQSILLGLQRKKADLAAQISPITNKLIPVLEKLGELRTIDPQAAPAKFHLDLLNGIGKVRPLDDISKELANDFKRTGYEFIDYEMRLVNNAIPSTRLRITNERVQQLRGIGNWPDLDLSQDITKLTPLMHEVEITDSAINKIVSNDKAREVEALIGRSSSDEQNTNLSTPFLFQLNITRFGTISLVAIGLGILSPLYRFSARLAAFYQARADALRLHQVAYEQISIVEIINVLTPEFDFAKSSSAEDSVLALTKLLSPKDKG